MTAPRFGATILERRLHTAAAVNSRLPPGDIDGTETAALVGDRPSASRGLSVRVIRGPNTGETLVIDGARSSPALVEALLAGGKNVSIGGSVLEVEPALEELPIGQASPEPVAVDFIDRVVAQGLSLPEARHRVAEELEQRYLRRALEQTAGNVTAAAKRSGIARRYFQILKAKAVRGRW